MAKKAVGRIGRAEIEPTVAGEGGGRLPISRPSKKLLAGIQVMLKTCSVGFIDTPQAKDVYRFLNYYRFRWDGEKWHRTFRMRQFFPDYGWQEKHGILWLKRKV